MNYMEKYQVCLRVNPLLREVRNSDYILIDRSLHMYVVETSNFFYVKLLLKCECVMMCGKATIKLMLRVIKIGLSVLFVLDDSDIHIHFPD